jgi:Xaa-Pro aminopeptidase
MAFKLDFTKLRRPRSAEEIEANYQAQRAEARIADKAKRAAFAGKTVIMAVSEVYARFTVGGDRDIQIWGPDDKGRQTRARLFIPECY